MGKFRLQLTKAITKLAVSASRRLGHHGTSLPGLLSYILYPGILKPLSKNVTTVFITGTNGKSTTASFVYHLLGPEEAFTNGFGSNMETGIITSFLENSDRNGDPIKGLAVMECDECNLPLVARFVKHPIVAVLNVYQEQEERYGSVKEVTDAVILGINRSEAEAVCMGTVQKDLTARLKKETSPAMFWTFGAGRTDTDIKVTREGYLVKVDTGDLQGTYPFGVPGDFNTENLAAALSVLKALGRCTEKELNRIGQLKPVEWHCQKLEFKDHSVQLFLVKNTESLNRCMKLAGKTVCFYFEKSIVDGTSTDWIRNADFKEGMVQVEKAFCAGDFAKSVEESLKESLKTSKRESLETSKKESPQETGTLKIEKLTEAELLRFLETSTEDVTVLANVEAMKKLRKKLEPKHD